MAFRRTTALLVLCALVLVVYITTRTTTRDATATLAGFWSGDDEFMRTAGLTKLHMFIAPMNGTTTTASIYMSDGDAIVANRNLALGFSGGLLSEVRSGARSLRGGVHRPYRFERVEVTNGGEIFPDTVKLELDMVAGSLAIHDGDQLLAFMWRDNEASFDALAVYIETADN